jgi:Na+/H+ antiporter NhaC
MCCTHAPYTLCVCILSEYLVQSEVPPFVYYLFNYLCTVQLFVLYLAYLVGWLVVFFLLLGGGGDSVTVCAGFIPKALTSLRRN